MILLAPTFYASPTLAGFHIPDNVYRIDQLQQAKEEAKNGEKQIVFVYSNEHCTSRHTARASINMMERFRNDAVIVFASYEGQDDWCKIPPIVGEALSSPEAGEYIPITVVVDPGMTKVVSIIPYQRLEMNVPRGSKDYTVEYCFMVGLIIWGMIEMMTGRIIIDGVVNSRLLRSRVTRETNPLFFWLIISVKLFVAGRILVYVIEGHF